MRVIASLFFVAAMLCNTSPTWANDNVIHDSVLYDVRAIGQRDDGKTLYICRKILPDICETYNADGARIMKDVRERLLSQYFAGGMWFSISPFWEEPGKKMLCISWMRKKREADTRCYIVHRQLN